MIIEWFKGFTVEDAEHLRSKAKIVATEHGDYEWGSSACLMLEGELNDLLPNIDVSLLLPTVSDFYENDYDSKEHISYLSGCFSDSLEYLKSLDIDDIEEKLKAISCDFREEVQFLVGKWRNGELIFFNIIK